MGKRIKIEMSCSTYQYDDNTFYVQLTMMGIPTRKQADLIAKMVMNAVDEAGYLSKDIDWQITQS